MDSSETPPAPPAFEDRSVGLTVFGIVLVLLGLLAAAMVPLGLFGMIFMARAGAGGVAPLVAGASVVGFYGGAAVVLTWLGIGSIVARRWARALIVAVSWWWLATGILSVGGFVAMLAVVRSGIEWPARATPGALAAGMAVAAVFLLFFFILLPVALLAFYAGDSVRRTVERRDPVPRWTDAAPLPLLTVATGFALLAFSMLPGAVAGLPTAWFGLVFVGWSSALAMLASAAALSAVAVGLYRRRGWSWGLALALVLAWCASQLVSFATGATGRLMAELPRSPFSTAMAGRFVGPFAMLTTLATGLGALGLLLWVRRYLGSPSPPGLAPAGEPASSERTSGTAGVGS